MRRFPQIRFRTAGLIAVTAVTCLGLLATAPEAGSQTATTFSVESIDIGLGTADLRQTIINIIRIALGLVTLAAVGYLVYGGFLWLTAGGREQQVEKAKRVILQALIGLVIILLAWAIVVFVARTVANSTSGGNGGGPGPGCPFCPPPPRTDFSVIGVTSCAARPEYDENVPRSSNVAITFSARVDASSVKQAVEDATSAPNLLIERCADNPMPANVTDCTTWSTPHPITNQVFTPLSPGPAPAGRAGATLAEWVARRNTITFYHLSFSADETDLANNRWFESDTIYRVTVPRDDPADSIVNPTAILDTLEPGRPVRYCRADEFNPIEGGGCSEVGDTIQWLMRTGTDTEGPVLSVNRTVPTSDPDRGYPDRTISRKPVLGVEFNNAIDANSLDTSNFQVFPLTADPRIGDPDLNDPASWPSDPALPANLFNEPNYTPTGAFFTLSGDNLLAPFTWYKIEVRDVRNLCGTLMNPNPAIWTFQTNDAVPGVRLLYPRNGSQNSCPSTEVFVQFRTPMWTPNANDCQVGSPGSYVRSGTLNPMPNRTFGVADNFDPDDPNHSCLKYAWTPTTELLSPNTDYAAAVDTDLIIDQSSNTLDPTWSFRTKTADTCFQEPYISRISPPSAATGACVSVIGNYFEKPLEGGGRESDGQNAGDLVNLETEPQPVIENAWSNRTIVSEVTPGALATDRTHQYRVTVNYDAPIGPLESNEEDFFLEAGAGGGGVCLLSVNPDSGPVGTGVDATGKRFGDLGGASRFRYVLGPTVDWDVQGSWSSDRIENIVVTPPSTEGEGEVYVVRDPDTRESNHVAFDVTPIPGGRDSIPRVEQTTTCDPPNNQFPSPNPKRGDTQACLNSLISARFTIPMDAASITTVGNIFLEECNPNCTTVGSTVAFVVDRGFTLQPAALLTPATRYQVTITTGVRSDANIPLASRYTWSFTTKNDATNCPIQNVGVSNAVVAGVPVQSTPTSFLFRAEPFGVQSTAAAYGAECRQILPGSATFTWTNSQPVVCTLTGNTGEVVACFNTDPPGAAEDTTQVRVSAEGKNSPNIAITFDSTRCVDTGQCATNGLGEQCPGSICDSGRCTPVINAIEPTDGPVGEMVTTKGCWFGRFDANHSRMSFLGTNDPADDRAGVVPDQLICGPPGNTWLNERIYREVPNAETLELTDDAVTGPVQIRRFDDVTADGPVFTLNNDPLSPGVCRVTPNRGRPGTAITLKGFRLGPDEAAQRPDHDQVNITRISSPTATVMSLYHSWADNSINTEIPAMPPVELGGSEIRAMNADQLTSNSVAFTVLDPAAATAECTTNMCADDSQCAPAADLGCARDHCCRPRPRLQTSNPTQGATGICRNILPQVSFDLPLDPRTVTSDTVRYLDDARNVDGRISVSGGTITYNPGLLSASRLQQLHLTTLVSVPAGLVNPSFEQADNAGVPTGWGIPRGATQSVDRPPGHTGYSVLVDCTPPNCPPNTQSYIAQTFPTAEPIGTTYRVTGWVKTEQPDTVSSGLISQCNPFGPCGYDLIARAPGLFVGNSGGWKKADWQITKVANAGARLVINCFAGPGAKVWCDDVTVEEVSIPQAPANPTNLRGRDGVLANVTSGPMTSPVTFTTGAEVCRADQVHVQPIDGNDRFTAINEQRQYTAFVTARNGQVLNNLDNVYYWDWSWRSAQATIASVQGVPAEVNAGTGRATVTAVSNGTTKAIATATVTEDASGGSVPVSVSGEGDVIVDICDHPWDVGQPDPGYADSNFHFQLFYCRGQQGDPLLPNFSYLVRAGVSPTDPTRLASIFFKENASTRDAIGLLVYDNPGFLSPADWYRQRFPQDSSGSSTIIAGYPALRTGTTAYIGFSDLNGPNLRGIILVIDYNSNNAEGDTRTIFTRILNTIRLNTNISDQLQRQQIVRDTKRRQDIRSVALLLEAHRQAQGSYPALSGGSYLVGLSTSAWPSWQQTLANALGRALPSDPTNGFSPACVPPNVPSGQGYEPSSCWSEPQRSFQCPGNSHIYLYRTGSGGTRLYANMEYSNQGTFQNYSGDACSGYGGNTSCSCFTYEYQLP